VAAVAHGGVLMQPRIVEKVRSADGKTEEVFGPKVVGNVVSAKAARLTLKAMEKVPTKEGTAPLAAVPGVVTAGKTGTAQKVDPGTRGYGEGRIASFIGVAPSADPRLVIFVMVDEPQDSPYGGIVAAPAFREIAMGALPLMGVGVEAPPPAKDAPAALVSAPAVDPLAGAHALAAKLAADDPLDGIDEGESTPQEGAVPNLVGMNARAAIREALKAGLEPALDGSGVVASQKPAAGRPIKGERVLRLTLTTQRRDG
jgi:cell division protein FtsI (penicillin-binding protein 3)